MHSSHHLAAFIDLEGRHCPNALILRNVLILVDVTFEERSLLAKCPKRISMCYALVLGPRE